MRIRLDWGWPAHHLKRTNPHWQSSLLRQSLESLVSGPSERGIADARRRRAETGRTESRPIWVRRPNRPRERSLRPLARVGAIGPAGNIESATLPRSAIRSTL